MINENSFIRRPPIGLEPKQVRALNAMSFSVDICCLAFKKLEDDLIIFSDNPNSDGLVYSKIFSNVWAIINNVSIIGKILKTQFKIDEKNVALSEINKAILMRNTNQHIDERINEVFSLNTLPIYGSLSWCSSIENSKKVKQFFIYSGTFEKVEEVGGEVVLPNTNATEKVIEQIIFNSVVNEASRKNPNYQEFTLSLNEIMEHLEIWGKPY